MTTQLLSDEATRDIFLAVVYELLKTDSAAGLLKAARG
jgi:type I restriction enzyme R subunit